MILVQPKQYCKEPDTAVTLNTTEQTNRLSVCGSQMGGVNNGEVCVSGKARNSC